MSKPPVVAIAGPTAAGKTALGLTLARRFHTEVVGVDSRQVYRGMDIGTAKPKVKERAQTPHHLIDVAEPTQEFSLAAFLDLARTAVGDIHNRGKLPILVGGTGQYLWALLEAWRVPSVPPDHAYRRELEALAQVGGTETLHSRLAEVDSQAAAAIDPRNVRRVIRALEVHHGTGLRFSELSRRGSEPYRALILGLTLPREELYARIDRRVDEMVEGGWIEEVRGLLSRGVAPDYPSMASVGYRELASYTAGEIALRDAIHNIKISTHRFARHQYTWFRRTDPRIHWLQAVSGLEESACSLVEAFLADSR